MFEKADTSGDGSISRQELRDLVSAVYAARDGVRLQDQVSTTARKLSLGPAALLARKLSSLGCVCSRRMDAVSQGAEAAAAAALRVAEADAVFEKADTDGSGAIDYEEFAVAASNTSFLRTGNPTDESLRAGVPWVWCVLRWRASQR